jgi:hypothetical protein
MEKVIKVSALKGYRIRVEFSDGTSGIVELADRLFGPMFEPLKDSNIFAAVSIDEFGAVVWPNGADLAPDALYERLKGQTANR